MIKKVLLIALLCLLLAFNACSKPVAIKVYIQVYEASGYFEIQNGNSYDWKDVQLTLDGYYTCTTVSEIPAGYTYRIQDDEFAKPDGTRFNLSTMKPLTILIECQTPKCIGIYDGVLAKPVAINADVQVYEASGYFEIKNMDSYPWEDVQLTLDRYYTYTTVSEIPAGYTYRIQADEFAKLDGTRFNLSTMKPLTILIECQTPQGRGVYEAVLAATEGLLSPI